MLHAVANDAAHAARRIRDDDTTKEFVRSLIDDELALLRSRFEDLDLETSSRMLAAEEALIRAEHEVRRMREEEGLQATQLFDAASGSTAQFESALDKVEAAISGLLHDLALQGQELERWRRTFRHVGLDDNEDGPRRQDRKAPLSLPQRVAQFESQLRAAELSQRELRSRHEQEQGYFDVDVRESIRMKDYQAVDGKLRDVDNVKHAFTGRFVEWERRAATDEVVMRTHARLVQQMQAERAVVKRRLGALEKKTKEGVRYLQAGLHEVHTAEDALVREVDLVRRALVRGAGGGVPVVMT